MNFIKAASGNTTFYGVTARDELWRYYGGKWEQIIDMPPRAGRIVDIWIHFEAYSYDHPPQSTICFLDDEGRIWKRAANDPTLPPLTRGAMGPVGVTGAQNHPLPSWQEIT